MTLGDIYVNEQTQVSNPGSIGSVFVPHWFEIKTKIFACMSYIFIVINAFLYLQNNLNNNTLTTQTSIQQTEDFACVLMFY